MRHRRAWTVALIVACFGGTSCVSTDQYDKAIADKDGQIRNLREERARLKGELQEYMGQLDDMSVQLQDASMQPPVEPETAFEGQPGLLERGIGYERRNGVVVITIPSSVSFASGSTQLSDQGQAGLREVAAVLKRSHAGSVYHIEGHTDTDPIRKSKFASNRELSIARAMAVLTYLVEDARVPDDQCIVVGAGQYRPLDAGTSEAAKARNRRVEIVVHESS